MSALLEQELSVGYSLSLQRQPVESFAGQWVGRRVLLTPKIETESPAASPYALHNSAYIQNAVALAESFKIPSTQLIRLSLAAGERVQQYRKRLGDVLIAVAEESSRDTGVKDFLRFLDESSLTKLPRALMAAAPSDGITIAWRKDRKRLSITFVGNRKAMVVILSPGKRTTANLVDCEALEDIVSTCTWIDSSHATTY